jgi:hypothetical protein
MVLPFESKFAPNDRFVSDTIEVVGLARNAYSKIIEKKCPESKAVSAISSAFGIHRKLAWQVIKVAYSDDPFVAARHMPTRKGLGAWIQAIESSGVQSGLIESVRNADEKFQTLIETHASSKSEFDILIESSISSNDPQADERWRQQAFEGNSFIWGVHCKLLLAMCVLMPSEDREDYFHMAQVRGLIGYRQTRPDVRWLVNQSVAVDDDTQHQSAMQRVAIDPQAAIVHNGVPVLPEFCSDPMPTLVRTKTPDGMMQDEFVSADVGLQGQRSLVTGEILRNIAPTYAQPNDKVAHFGTAIRTPAELLHFDMFVSKGLFGEVERSLRVFSDIASQIAFQDSDALSMNESVTRLGTGLNMAQTPDLPGYRDLASSVFDRLGTDPDGYELFRVRIAYPPMPTTVMMKHELLPKDGEFEEEQDAQI